MATTLTPPCKVPPNPPDMSPQATQTQAGTMGPPGPESNPGTAGAPTVPPAQAEFLDIKEVADLLRKTVRAAYAASERGQIPGRLKIGTRVLFHRATLLDSLTKRASSSTGGRR